MLMLLPSLVDSAGNIRGGILEVQYDGCHCTTQRAGGVRFTRVEGHSDVRVVELELDHDASHALAVKLKLKAEALCFVVCGVWCCVILILICHCVDCGVIRNGLLWMP